MDSTVGFLPGWFRAGVLTLVLKRGTDLRFKLTAAPYAWLALVIGCLFVLANLMSLTGWALGPVGMVVGLAGVLSAGVWFNVLLGGYKGQTLLLKWPLQSGEEITMNSTGLDFRVAYLAAPVVAFSAYVFATIGAVSMVLLTAALSPSAFLLAPALVELGTGTVTDMAWATASFMFLVDQSKFKLIGNDGVGQFAVILLVGLRSLMLVLLLPTLLQGVLEIGQKNRE